MEFSYLKRAIYKIIWAQVTNSPSRLFFLVPCRLSFCFKQSHRFILLSVPYVLLKGGIFRDSNKIRYFSLYEYKIREHHAACPLRVII